MKLSKLIKVLQEKLEEIGEDVDVKCRNFHQDFESISQVNLVGERCKEIWIDSD